MSAPRSSFFLALECDAWHVARVVGDDVATAELPLGDQPPAAMIPAVRETLQAMGHQGESLCLGIASKMIHAMPVQPPRVWRQKRQAMLFLVEEQLPLDAEQLSVEFLPPVGDTSLALAVETARLRELIEPLEGAGLAIEHIVPTALLATHCVGAVENRATGNAHGVAYHLVCSNSHVDVLRVARRTPIAWSSVPKENHALLRQLRAELLANPLDDATVLRSGQASPELWTGLDAHTGLTSAAWDSASILPAAARAAARLSRDNVGLPDFRTGELASASRDAATRKARRFALITALLFLLCLFGTLLLRTHQLNVRHDELRTQQAAEHAKVFPGLAVPPDVVGRLRSEHQRLTGISGSSGSMPARPDALETLRHVMTALPGDLRLRIVDLRIGPAEAFIEGQARSHVDAEAFAQALRQSGLDAQPPRSETRTGEGVAFSMAIKLTERTGP
jgi:type II secretion system protein L